MEKLYVLKNREGLYYSFMGYNGELIFAEDFSTAYIMSESVLKELQEELKEDKRFKDLQVHEAIFKEINYVSDF